MKESAVERHLNTRVKGCGGVTRKWTSPGHAGVEDRICFFQLGELWFIEVKQQGKLPNDAQWREIMLQRNMGHNAGYLAGEHEVDAFIFSQDRETWMTQHVQKCPEEWKEWS